MKTHPFARSLLRIRAVVFALAMVGLVGVEVGLGPSLAARFGQSTAAQTEAPQAPSLGVGDFMAACPVAR